MHGPRDGGAAGFEQRRRHIHLAYQFPYFQRTVEPRSGHYERNVDRAIVRTAFVLRVAGFEVAAMIAGEQHDGVVEQPLLFERVDQRADGIVDVGDAAVIVGKLARPGAW